MNIKRYNIAKSGIKLYKVNINYDGGVDMNTNALQRPCTILQSIEESFKQIGEYKQGKIKFKSLKESQVLWDKWAKEVEEENGGNDTDI